MTLEVKSVESLLGTPVPYAYAVKAGPWIFLTGHEAYRLASGAIDEAVAGPPGYPAVRQHTRAAARPISSCNRMRRHARGIRHRSRAQRPARPVLPEPARGRRLSPVRHDAFGDYIPPSTSVVMERCFGGGSTISTSLIAVVPEPGYEIRKIHPPGVASAPTSGFVPAVVCNEFVFVAGQMAHNPGTGLDPRAIVPEHSAWAGIPIRKQTEFLILEKLKPALEAAGSSLEQSVKAQIYLADIADMPDCLDVWNQHYAGIPCAVTVVPTKSFATVGGIIEINLIALTDRRDAREGGDRGRHPRHGGVRAVHQGRRVPAAVRADGDRPRRPCRRQGGVAGLSRVWRMPDTARRRRSTTMPRRCAGPPGRRWTRLLRAQYFVADIAAFPGIAMAWSARYGGQPHPFVCVQTPAPMPAPGAALIADFWISTA